MPLKSVANEVLEVSELAFCYRLMNLGIPARPAGAALSDFSTSAAPAAAHMEKIG